MKIDACKNEYAKLIVEGGIRLQPGERVQINSDVNCYDMARRVAERCYQQGAAKVEIRWSDAHIDDLSVRYADEALMKQVPVWEEEQMREQAEQLPCLIHLLTTDPIESSEETAARQAEIQAARLQVLMPHILKMCNHYRWTAVCIPSQPWADLLYPSDPNNLDRLWEDILRCVMVTGDGSSVSRWEEKFRAMWTHMDRLNEMGLRRLHMESELGTDLWVNLHPDAEFHCASGPEDGCAFNIPSEELYTSPMAMSTEGMLVASCPLIYENQIVSGLRIRFEHGQAVEIRADKGEAFFQELLQTDAGAGRLGEVAIIDRHSPEKALGHLMYHTLFDENAACHVAVGRGFEYAIRGYKGKSTDEMAACDINNSGIHCDIMWGTDESRITAYTADGNSHLILDHGEWQI